MLYYNLRLPLLRYFSRLLTAVEPWVFTRLLNVAELGVLMVCVWCVAVGFAEAYKKEAVTFRLPLCDSARIQTWNRLIRSQVLYSVELRSHIS